MNTRRKLYMALAGLVAAPAALPAMAQQQPPGDEGTQSPASGLTELTDEEMGDMRGRYTVGKDTVAWFGVTMVSNWQTQAGQTVQSRVTLGIDVSQPDKPKITFQPHVSITAIDAPMPTPSGERTIDHSGLANVSGLVQSVQVAGDGNRASNTARIRLREQDQVPTTLADQDGTGSLSAMASSQGMSAEASLQDNIARVLLQVDGHGAVEQWVGRSGMGQSIRLTSDGQQASNWMELDLVRSPVATTRLSLASNVAQAIALSRGIGIGY